MADLCVGLTQDRLSGTGSGLGGKIPLSVDISGRLRTIATSVFDSPSMAAMDPGGTAAAYSADDVIGGPIALPGALPPKNGPSFLEQLKFTDAENQKPGLQIVLFDLEPKGAGWKVANKAPLEMIADGLIDLIVIPASKWNTVAGVGWLVVDTHIQVRSTVDRTVWMAIVATNPVTYKKKNSLRVTPKFIWP